MRTFRTIRSARPALLCIAMMSMPPVLPAQTPTTTTPAAPARPPAPAPTPPSAAAGAKPDLGWPRTYEVQGGSAVLYQPQVATWEDQRRIVAWSAVAYQAKDAKTPNMGTIKIEANTEVALDDRLVSFKDFEITESSFQTLSRDQTREIVSALQDAMPEGDRVIGLDRVMAAMDTSTIRPREVSGVKADPPLMFSSTKPAILVGLDGPVVWNQIRDVDLEYAVNTNWDLFRHAPSSTVYLRNETSWLKAPDVGGPWTPAGPLPESFTKLPADENFADVRTNVPGKSISASAMPTVYVATVPSELILVKGEPAYQAVSGTSLLWVSNTESDVFRLGKTGEFYYLVAGRWFSSAELKGPWTFATPILPEDFKRIPIEHPRSRVLASVPGTDQANEAILLAQIPQTARVSRKDLKAPEVTYQGEPEFEPITGTSLERAVNTDKDIIKVGDLYYMCFQAVWFMSRSASGPWEVATSVPKEIYVIPASSPAHNVTYVTVQESNPNDDWVTFAYVAGYTGMMMAWGCMVWGTGWYYPPYVWGWGGYPVYYGYPHTYGFSAWYNPYTGAYGRGAGVYGPYGGIGAGAVYNPRTGTYARGATAYGPYGSRTVASAWNPRTGTVGATRQGSNIYGNWGTSAVQRGDAWARTGHVTNYRTGATTSGIQTSRGGEAVSRSGAAGRTTVGRTGSGDVYAGHDGNVYRKSGDGSWQSWENGGWNNSTADRSQLERDYQARQNGEARTRDASSYQNSPSRTRASSYPSSHSRGGGAMRGGGGRRR